MADFSITTAFEYLLRAGVRSEIIVLESNFLQAFRLNVLWVAEVRCYPANTISFSLVSLEESDEDKIFDSFRSKFITILTSNRELGFKIDEDASNSATILRSKKLDKNLSMFRDGECNYVVKVW